MTVDQAMTKVRPLFTNEQWYGPATVQRVNRALTLLYGRDQFRLWAGKGYYYCGGKHEFSHIVDSIYLYRIRHVTLEQAICTAVTHIERALS